MEEILKGLNEEQKKAVLHLSSPLLVLAGAGSGKTRVITHKIMYLNRELGIPINRILAITFTNKAAKEMKERVMNALGLDEEPKWIATFHSISAKILRIEAQHLGYKPNFIIYDEEDSKKLISEILKELNLPSEKEFLNKIKENISQVKQSETPELEIEFIAVDYPAFIDIFNKYQEELKKANAMDFDDIINNLVKLFEENELILEKWRNRFDYILVDEYQDTNKIQHKLLKLLVGDRDCISVVGDPQQCIYTWRGATPENILEFEKDFPNTAVVKLEKNYRSTKKILQIANKIISKANGRWRKKILNLWTENEEGEDIKLFKLQNEWEEKKFLSRAIKELTQKQNINYSDIAILIRMSYLSRAIEEEFIYQGIPYQIIGGLKFYERAEIKDLLAYFKLAINPQDKQAFKRALTTPSRNIADAGIKKIEKIKEEQNLDWLEALKEAYDRFNEKTKIKIQEFLEIMEYITSYGINHPYKAIKHLYEAINYYEYLLNKYPKDWEDRKKNIEELFKVMLEIEKKGKTLKEFLEETTLSQAQDNLENTNSVKIMTIHASKGLEFPIVFLPALEDGIFPSGRSLTTEEEKEEERRLFYVAITRAKRELYLSFSQKRSSYTGRVYETTPSRFLKEIKNHIKIYSTKKPANINKKAKTTGTQKIRKTTTSTKSSINSSGISTNKLKKGALVKHKKFGKGVVEKLEGNKAIIIFENGERKKIISDYLEMV